MKSFILKHFNDFLASLKPISFVIFIILAITIVATIVVRQQCVLQGYEISKLAMKIDEKNLEHEVLSRQYYDFLRSDELIRKALEMGFVFPSGDRVFYVR